MTQETPTEHSSLVGGSSASRRINCPGSYAREKKAPKSKGSAYAREGTALHEMIAQILDHNKTPSELLPFTHKQPAKGVEDAWELTIEDELWDTLGRPALDMFDAFLDELEADQDGEPAVYMIEESAEFPGIPGAFGTSDVPFRCGKVGGIWDWKFGRNKVDAEDNSQLLFYFRAVLAKYPAFFEGIDRVMLCISQPQVNDQEPDVWETTLEDVYAFEADLIDAINEAMQPDAHIERGPWCKFADCKAVCELHVGATAELGKRMAALEEVKTAAVRAGDSGSAPKGIEDMGAFLSEAMELAEMAEDWAKHIAGITQERLEGGLPVAGYKLVEKRSSGRIWSPDLTETQIVDRLRTRGLKADSYYVKNLVSPPQAEKALKLIGKELPEDAVIKKPSSGYTLTREGDPRSKAVPPMEKAAALGASLLRQIGATHE